MTKADWDRLENEAEVRSQKRILRRFWCDSIVPSIRRNTNLGSRLNHQKCRLILKIPWLTCKYGPAIPYSHCGSLMTRAPQASKKGKPGMMFATLTKVKDDKTGKMRERTKVV